MPYELAVATARRVSDATMHACRLACMFVGATAIMPAGGVAQAESEIQVVTAANPEPLRDDIGWRVGAPLVEIGGVQTALLNVQGATRIATRQIVIANAGTDQLLVYTLDGQLIREIGREGAGPGEFQFIASMMRGVGDTLHVFDSRQQRVTALEANGSLAWDRLVRPTARVFGEAGRFADGRWYGREVDRVARAPDGTLRQDTIQFVFLGENLSAVMEEIAFPGIISASFRGVLGEGGKMTAPFSPEPEHDEYGECLYVSRGDFDIEVYSSTGELRAEVSNPWPRRRVTAEAFDSWVETRLEVVPEEARPSMRQVLMDVPRPRSLPAYNSLIVDALGYVWAGLYDPPDGVGRFWLVFGPDGQILGQMTMPRPLELLEVGADYLLALWSGADGTDTVGMFELQRNANSTPRVVGDGLCGTP